MAPRRHEIASLAFVRMMLMAQGQLAAVRPRCPRSQPRLCSGRRAASPPILPCKRVRSSAPRLITPLKLYTGEPHSAREQPALLSWPTRDEHVEPAVQVHFMDDFRGFGVVATRRIAEGELILTEQPLLTVQRKFSFPLGMSEGAACRRCELLLADSLYDALGCLTQSQLQVFDALSSGRKEITRSNIFHTNAIETGSSTGSVFALCSRINQC